MGMLNVIQNRISDMFANKGVEREANDAFDKFMTVASMRESELNGAISKLARISVISKRIGQATEKRVDNMKAQSPIEAHASRPNANAAKIARAQQLKARFSDLMKHDNTGYAELYAEAQDIRKRCQSSPLADLSNEAKINALAAISRCESAGVDKTAYTLSQAIDAKQCAIEEARDGVISQFRFSSEDLAKNDPQLILITEMGRQDAHISAADRQMRGNASLTAIPGIQVEPHAREDKTVIPSWSPSL